MKKPTKSLRELRKAFIKAYADLQAAEQLMFDGYDRTVDAWGEYATARINAGKRISDAEHKKLLHPIERAKKEQAMKKPTKLRELRKVLLKVLDNRHRSVWEYERTAKHGRNTPQREAWRVGPFRTRNTTGFTGSRNGQHHGNIP